ncbi:unnamed protein product [Gongylonema pulchrum]|uniref:DUF58 domain-containing protein n=1 Tax=Gongylonema pulchrum TaxID=637853 RepID=A0A183DGC1_9BILA|nr:unnamed protein product [Gongylonema pulchrum]
MIGGGELSASSKSDSVGFLFDELSLRATSGRFRCIVMGAQEKEEELKKKDDSPPPYDFAYALRFNDEALRRLYSHQSIREAVYQHSPQFARSIEAYLEKRFGPNK